MQNPRYTVRHNFDDPTTALIFNNKGITGKGTEFPTRIYSNTSFDILLECKKWDNIEDKNDVNYNLTGITGATCYIKPAGTTISATNIGTGELVGDGVVLFTIDSDLIPDNLAQYTSRSNPTPIVLYLILEDSVNNNKISLETRIEVMDIDRDGTENNQAIEASGINYNAEQTAKWTARFNELPTVLETAINLLAREQPTDKGRIISQLGTQPSSPTDGDRYIATATEGDWTEDKIYEWNDADIAWVEYTPQAGDEVWDSNLSRRQRFDETSWGDINAVIGTDAIAQSNMKDNSVGTAEIIDENVTNPKLANMAEATVKGRSNGSGTGDPEDLSQSQLREIVNQKGVDVESAAALTLGSDGNYFDVTGTTDITSINTVAVGASVTIQFDDSLTLTHNATSLILPGGTNISTAAGDVAKFTEYSTGNWKCTSYSKADGTPITGGGGSSLPVDDTTTIVRDPTNNTKTMRIDVGAVAADNERVLFMPNKDVDLTPDSGSFIKNIVADTTPELGGTLSTNSNDIDFGNDSDILNLNSIDFKDFLELTVSGGSITASQALHTVDTQADAGTDDLDTIVVGTGNLLYLTLENPTRIVTLKDGTGNLDIGADIIMAADTVYQLVYNGTSWNAVGANASGGTSLPVDDTISIVRDPADNTKQIRLDAGDISTDSTRVVTVPDEDVMIFPQKRVTGLATKGTVDINWKSAKFFIIGTLTGDVTLTFSNITQAQTIYIDVTGDSGYTFDLPASVAALEGTSFTPDVRNIIKIESVDAATTQEAVFNLDTASGAVSADELNNLIIDGQFNHWDEGTSFTSTGYTATMWKAYVTGVTTPTIDRQSFTIGQTDVPDNPKYYIELDADSEDVETTNIHIHQDLKDVTKLSGKTVTLSFWAKGSVAGSIGVRCLQLFGTGGSPSTSVKVEGELISITTSWARYTAQITLPSVSDKTLGTNNNDRTGFKIDRYLGTSRTGFYPLDNNPTYSGTLSIANVALVEGTTAFAEGGAWPTAEQERERILPFFERKDFSNSLIATGQATGSGSVRFSVNYTEKINTPSVSIVNAGNIEALDSAGNFAGGSASPLGGLGGSCEFKITGASGLAAGNASNARANGSASIIFNSRM